MLGDEHGAGDERACARTRGALPPATDRIPPPVEAVPELRFVFDESIAGQDRIEQILDRTHDHADPTGS